MTEYEEICDDKSVINLQDELQYQYSLGYSSTDSFPNYIREQIEERTRETITIKLKGVDSWGRPVYKVQGLNVYLGDVNKLWYGIDKTKEVIDKYYKDNLSQLVIFGNAYTDDIGDTFDEVDPLGTNLKKDIKINII